MTDDKLNKLSLAMKVLSILEKENSASKLSVTEESRPAEDATVDPLRDPVEPLLVGAGSQHLIGVRLISRRDEIPISEKHILVMWGLSTYRFEHPLGVTFAVDNGLSNTDRDQQYREVQLAALELARAVGLPFIYVLN